LFKFLFACIILFSSLIARENPFFATEGEKDIPFTSNKNRTKEPLKRATITLPSSARILQKVTIEYKNLDGSIEKKSIQLNNFVDWHLPIFISQNYNIGESRTTTKKIYKSKIKNKKQTYKKVASIKYAKFYIDNKRLKILTKDTKIRDFLLVDPHRIVLDFKRESKMKSYKKILEGRFSSIRIGNHNGYYRVVIELDGLYKYNLQKISNGFIINLQ